MKKVLFACFILVLGVSVLRAQEAGIPVASSIQDGECAGRIGGVTVGVPCGGTPSTANRIISGGNVAWASGLDFVVSATVYTIGGQQYTANQTTVSLNAADGSNPRYDLIIVDDTSSITKITGTAAAAPVIPTVDPTTQLQVTVVYVPAAATTPGFVTNTNIYLENTEWTCAASDASNNCDSTNNPYAGSKDVEGTSVARGDYVQFTGTAQLLSNYTVLTLFIRSKAQWQNNRGLTLAFQLSGANVGVGVAIGNGSFGFDSSSTSTYQLVSIPVSMFNYNGNVDRLRITSTGGSVSQTIGYYLDNIILQTGVNPTLSISGVSPIQVSAGGVVSCPTCATTFSSVAGLDPNIAGGFIGALFASAITANQAAFASTQFRMSRNILMGTPSTVSEAANTGLLRQVWMGMRTPSGSGTGINNAPGSNTSGSFFIEPTAALGVYTGLQRFDFWPKYSLPYFNTDSSGIGTGNTLRGWVSPIYGAKMTPMWAALGSGTLTAGQVGYFAHSGAGFITTEAQVGQAIGAGGTMGALCVRIGTAQPASGSFVFQGRKNGTTNISTLLTIAASAPAGDYCGTVTSAYVRGDWYTISATNNSATTSAQVVAANWEFVATEAGYNAMIPFPRVNNGALTASANNYHTPLYATAVDATENTKRFPAGRAMIAKSLYCYNVTAATANVAVTIVQNGSASGTMALTYTAGVTGILGTTFSASIAATDYYDLNAASGASTQATGFNCALGVE